MDLKCYAGGVMAVLCLFQLHVDAYPVSDHDVTEINKRSLYEDLQAFRDRVVTRLNQYRRQRNLPLFEVDPNLEYGAQAWATSERRALKMSHSCEDCPGYSEILAKRRSTKVLPKGAEAGEWVFKSWFGEGDLTYSVIINNPDIHGVGFGVDYVRDPADGMYHAYAVGRFSRREDRRG